MSRFFALGMAAGVAVLALVAPTQVRAQTNCIPVASLDLNHDGWIDGNERRAARAQGITWFDRDGNGYITQDEYNTCVSGRAGGPVMSPAASMPMPQPYDPAAAYDTPPAQAAQAAQAYLDAKVRTQGVAMPPATAPMAVAVPAPVVSTAPAQTVVMPVATNGIVTSPGVRWQFGAYDANNDGVITRAEFNAARARGL